MLKTIAKIDWEKLGPCLFLTLTWPDKYKDRTYKERTADRWKFMKAVEKRAGRNIATLWRIEWQVRKSGECVGEVMPHMHIILFNVAFLHSETVRCLWGDTLEWEGWIATSVMPANDAEHAAKYAAKYAAKVDADVLDNAAYLERVSGRGWGLTRKPLIPFAERRTVRRLSAPSVARAKAVGERTLGRKVEGSFTIFNERSDMLAEIITPKRKKKLDTPPAKGR